MKPSAEWVWPDRVGQALAVAFGRWLYRRAQRRQRRAELRLRLAHVRAAGARQCVRSVRERLIELGEEP